MSAETIEVTADDITKGCRSRAYACPVHLAIKRVTGREFGVTHEYIRELHADQFYEVSYELKVWLKRYDARISVSPITFELRPAAAKEGQSS
jgi:hypothetical protein